MSSSAKLDPSEADKSLPSAAARERIKDAIWHWHTGTGGAPAAVSAVQPGASCTLQREVFANNDARWRAFPRDGPQLSYQRSTAVVPLHLR